MLAGFEMGVRPARHQLVPDRCLGPGDRVVVGIRALAPAVEDAQHDRAGTRRHRRKSKSDEEPAIYTRNDPADDMSLMRGCHCEERKARRGNLAPHETYPDRDCFAALAMTQLQSDRKSTRLNSSH